MGILSSLKKLLKSGMSNQDPISQKAIKSMNHRIDDKVEKASVKIEEMVSEERLENKLNQAAKKMEGMVAEEPKFHLPGSRPHNGGRTYSSTFRLPGERLENKRNEAATEMEGMVSREPNLHLPSSKPYSGGSTSTSTFRLPDEKLSVRSGLLAQTLKNLNVDPSAIDQSELDKFNEEHSRVEEEQRIKHERDVDETTRRIMDAYLRRIEENQ